MNIISKLQFMTNEQSQHWYSSELEKTHIFFCKVLFCSLANWVFFHNGKHIHTINKSGEDTFFLKIKTISYLCECF